MRRFFFRPQAVLPDADAGVERVRSMFRKFRRILELNTRLLERMAEMERALGGEYIFDSAFLESATREACAWVYQVAYCVNGLSGDRYLALYDRFQDIKGTLEDILAGGLGPQSSSLTLPFSALRWEMEPLVGLPAACLAEFRHRLGLRAPDGFALTVAGCRCFLQSAGLADPADLADASFPEPLAENVRAEVRALFERRGGKRPLDVVAVPAGGFDRATAASRRCRAADAADLPRALGLAMADLLASLDGEPDVPLAAAVFEAVGEAADGAVCGEMLTRDPAAPGTVLIAAESAFGAERYRLRRIQPFDPVESEIVPKALDALLPGGTTPLKIDARGLRRGSAVLDLERLRSLAQSAATVERAMGAPQRIEWTLDGAAGRTWLLGARPLDVGVEDDFPEELAERLKGARVLARGGETAQAGAAAGLVVHVREEDDPETFPRGAVAVARLASPRLGPILGRAAAVVTEIGSAAGHLAAVAREARTPALFGVKDALGLLPAGVEITVDAGAGAVYVGALEPLLELRASGAELFPTDPEYLTLRRLLRVIMPLNLTDPDSPDFAPERCQTLHDIIHFAHERAVEELATIQDRHPELGRTSARRLRLSVPLDIAVLDMEEGLTTDAGEPVESAPGLPGARDELAVDLAADQVRSDPLRAFTAGLTRQGVWNDAPAPLRLKDILAGFGRTSDALNGPASGASLAIAARNYLNLSLRLGYHFSVVDAFMDDDPNKNGVYFRFAGGLTDETRRRRRAELVRLVLERMNFKAAIKGDLVIGKLKLVPKSEMEIVLAGLGALTAFTRQLDASMGSDEDVAALAERFFSLIGDPAESAGPAPAGNRGGSEAPEEGSCSGC